MSRRIAVLGSGSWGTALAIQLARAGHQTTMWGIETDEIASMARARCNTTYLPNASFPDALGVTIDFEEALDGADDVLVVVPSHAFRETMHRLADAKSNVKNLAWATKGFETESGLLPHQVAEDVLGNSIPTAVLSGPTFAAEVGIGLPSAIVIASNDKSYSLRLAELITTENFRAYTSTDITGVEVGGATKNVLAVGAGISDGLGFGANTRVALITRGLSEMTRLGVALGAQKDTFTGLSGMGDLVLTCTDDQSRNRRFGLALGKGADIEQARKAIGQVVEGYYAAQAVRGVAMRLELDMPIVEEIYKVLYQGNSPQAAVVTLMSRPITPE